jgi:16S rRNA processing protein RimM
MSQMRNPQRPTFLVVGVITRAHGIAGEVKVQTSPGYQQALDGVHRVYLNGSEQGTRIESQRTHQNAILLKLEGVNTRSDAEAMRGVTLAIKVHELPELPAGEFYAHQLVGLRVVDDAGTELGQLSDVLATGSNDVYIVKKPDGSELLLPAIESVIRKIDLDAHAMSVVVPPGLGD